MDNLELMGGARVCEDAVGLSSIRSHIIPRVAMGMPPLRTNIYSTRPRIASPANMTTKWTMFSII